MPTPHAPAAALPWRTGLAYGALALPLAFVSLPLYVTLPHHYATEAGAPLAALGMVLLATRGLDAVVDPALGRWADHLFRRGLRPAWQAAAGARWPWRWPLPRCGTRHAGRPPPPWPGWA